MTSSTLFVPDETVITSAWLNDVNNAVFNGVSVNSINVKMYGAVGNGVADDTAAIQSAINTGKNVFFPAGQYKISAQLNFNTIGQYFVGAGMELSQIMLTGAIKGFVSSGSLVRCCFRDLMILGNSITLDAIDVSSGTLYESNWQNLGIYCGGRAIYAPVEFGNTFQNIQFNSYNNHGIEISGDVGTTLIGCYAHRIDTLNANLCGYRVYSGGTFIGCNGLDFGDYWGIFGGGPDSDLFSPTLIGCNLEDFHQAGLHFMVDGRAIIQNCTFFPPAVPTNPTYQASILIDFTDQLIEIHNCIFVSKGATRVKLAEVFSAAGGAPLFFGSGTQQWDDNGNLSTAPNITTSQSAFEVFGMAINVLNIGRAYGFYSPTLQTWTANASTFSVASIDRVKTANTGSTNFTNATGGVDGQELTIVVTDSNTTLKHLAGGTGQFQNKTGADITATSGLAYKYMYAGSGWHQI